MNHIKFKKYYSRLLCGIITTIALIICMGINTSESKADTLKKMLGTNQQSDSHNNKERLNNPLSSLQNKKLPIVHYAASHYVTDKPVSGVFLGLNWTADPSTKVAMISGTQTDPASVKKNFSTVLPNYVTTIQLNNVTLICGNSLFAYLYNLTTIRGQVNTSHITSASQMFRDCYKLTDIKSLALWDMHNCNDFSHMFDSCYVLSDLTPLTPWNVGNGINFSYMFSSQDGSAISNIAPLSPWNVGNGLDFSSMFFGTIISDLTPLSPWNVGKGINFSDMFGDTKITNLTPLTPWNVGNGTDFSNMFQDCQLLVDIHGVIHWNVSKGTLFSYMFYGCVSLSDLSPLSPWNVGNGTDFSNMFSIDIYYQLHPPVLTDITPLTPWNVGKGTNFSNMFYGLSILHITPIEPWNINKNANLDNMFTGTAVQLDITNWPKEKLTNWNDLETGAQITIGGGQTWKGFTNDITTSIIVKGNVNPYTYVPKASEIINGSQVGTQSLSNTQTYTWCDFNRKPVNVQGYDGQNINEFNSGITLIDPYDQTVSWDNPDIKNQCTNVNVGQCDITYKNHTIAHIIRSPHTDAYGNVLKVTTTSDTNMYNTLSDGKDVLTRTPNYTINNMKSERILTLNDHTDFGKPLLTSSTNKDWNNDPGTFLESWRPNTQNNPGNITIAVAQLVPVDSKLPFPAIKLTWDTTAITAYNGTQKINNKNPTIKLSHAHNEITQLQDLRLYLQSTPIPGISYKLILTYKTGN